MNRPLSALRPGDRARVVGMEGDPETVRRLQDLGLIRGTPVEILRFAPLGDPVEVRVRGFSLSLRRSEADRITVVDG